jgi:selenoprotein W-related protein
MPRAVSLATELLQQIENHIESVALFPSDSGKFEVTVDGNLLFSKMQLHRHANPGEVMGLVKKYMQEHV